MSKAVQIHKLAIAAGLPDDITVTFHRGARKWYIEYPVPLGDFAAMGSHSTVIAGYESVESAETDLPETAQQFNADYARVLSALSGDLTGFTADETSLLVNASRTRKGASAPSGQYRNLDNEGLVIVSPQLGSNWMLHRLTDTGKRIVDLIQTARAQPTADDIAGQRDQSKKVGLIPAIPTKKVAMNLPLAITLAGQLDYDRLRDVRDLLEFQAYNDQIAAATDERERDNLRSNRNRIKLRIRGRHSTPDGGGKRWDDIRYPADLADVPDMDTGSRESLLATVKALIKAKQPVAVQRTKADGSTVARGFFQTKTKKNRFLVRDEEGKPALDKDGNRIYKDAHYWYFRLYIANQDGMKRPASVYIGSMNRQEPKPFYAAVRGSYDAELAGEVIEDWMITRDQLVAWFQEGGYERIKSERQAMDASVD